MLIPTHMSTPNGKIINGISSEEYDSWTGINASSLKKFLISPLHYKDWLDKKDNEPTSDAFRLGTAMHMLILEPHLFDESFKIAPDVDRRTVGGRMAWREFESQLNAEQDNYVDTKEMNMLGAMSKSVAKNSLWKALNSEGDKIVKEAGFECEYMGIKIKGRLDFFNKTQNIIVDWKTINDTPTKRTVKSEVYSKGYDVQNFLYQKGVEIVTGVKPKFYFAFVEKKAPHAIGFYELPEWRINEVKEMVDIELVRMENAKKTNIYAGLPSEICPMMLE